MHLLQLHEYRTSFYLQIYSSFTRNCSLQKVYIDNKGQIYSEKTFCLLRSYQFYYFHLRLYALEDRMLLLTTF